MFKQNNLDEIIKKTGSVKFEDATSLGINEFIESCSETIYERYNYLTEDYLHYTLYLLEYLRKHWTDYEKQTRYNKQICLKTLFIALLSEMQIKKCEVFLKQSVNTIAKHWEIKPNKYPFFTEKEETNFLDTFRTISNRIDVHIEFASIVFETTNKHSIFKYCPDKLFYVFIKLYEKFCCSFELEKDDETFLKAIFITVKKQSVFDTRYGILNILPLHFCITEMRKILEQKLKHNETKCLNSLPVENNVIFTAGYRLLFNKKNTEYYEPIPAWARWFFMAGQKIAADSTLNHNLTIGLSLPTRSYAVQFLLLGYETWNTKRIIADQNKNSSYFNSLAECEENEALLIWENGHWLRCWFKGVTTIEEKKCIKVEVSGSERRKHLNLVVETNIAKLRKAVDSEREVAVNQTGFGMSGLSSLASYYNKKENDILNFLINNESTYAVVGNISTIKKELDQEKLYLYQAGKYIEFSFQHFLRFKNFMTDFDFPRGEILSSKTTTDGPSHYNFPVVFYDGSLAYLNRHDGMQGNVEIVLLDRTEPQFSSACSELMARYYDRSDDVHMFNDIPVSIELVVFKE